jgi:hypothetical protein
MTSLDGGTHALFLSFGILHVCSRRVECGRGIRKLGLWHRYEYVSFMIWVTITIVNRICFWIMHFYFFIFFILVMFYGAGAGFYLNATQEKWKNWRMYDYLTKELPSLLSSHFPQLDTANASLFGHSMGGHGALTLFLKNSSKYKVHFLHPCFAFAFSTAYEF